MEATFVIVGGGIAGVTCAETLAFYETTEKIILISESSLIKTVVNLHAITQTLSNFDIEEKHMNSLSNKYNNITVLHDSLKQINDKLLNIETANNLTINYKHLCLCMGACPKLIPQAINNPYILGIRDTDSVEVLLNKLSTSKKIAIIGNGGIASELVYKIENAEVDWIIKDKHITSTFVDPGAAEFLKESMKTNSKTNEGPSKRMRYEDAKIKSGAALGPDWYKSLNIKGALTEIISDSVKFHFESEIEAIVLKPEEELPVEITLSNKVIIRCDLAVSATGVEPRSNFKTTTLLDRCNENGIKVTEFMQTSIPNIYAAGDICTPNWPLAKHWFPMKLWTQARQMGCYAARCMSSFFNNEQVLQDFCFELFTHTTKLFGYKVILLGLYNGQKLNKNYEILFRMTKGSEFVKFVLQDHKLQGAVLIGETDLEETCENLILNQIDLSAYKDDLLNPDIDIEDYFD